GEVDQSIVSALHCELVRCADKRQARQLRDFRSGSFTESGSRIDASPDGGTSESEGIHSLQCMIDPLEIVIQHSGVTGPFLTERDRGCILHMGTSDLDDLSPLFGLSSDGVPQGRYCRN